MFKLILILNTALNLYFKYYFFDFTDNLFSSINIEMPETLIKSGQKLPENCVPLQHQVAGHFYGNVNNKLGNLLFKYKN